MLANVVNLGAQPAIPGDLNAVFAKIMPALQQRDALGFGRAILSGEGAAATAPRSGIIMVQTGSLTLSGPDGAAIALQAGDAATLPAAQMSWQAKNADCVIILFIIDNPPLTLAKLDLGHEMTAGGSPNPALLTTPAPQTARHGFHDSGRLSWGTWRTTPYGRRPVSYSFTEIMMLRRGEVTLTNPEQGSATFHAGDIFVVHAGAVASWDNPSDVEKLWIIRTEDAGA